MTRTSRGALAATLFAGASLLTLTATANPGSGLRGFAPTPVYVGNAQYQPAPQDWQQRRLVAANPDVTYAHGGHVAGPVMAHTTAHYQPAPVQQAGYRPSLPNLRGLSAPRGVSYQRGATPLGFAISERIGVRTQPDHTRDMLDWQESTTTKTLTLLANRASGLLQDDSLYVGAGFQGGLMYQKTDTDGQFPLLSRFPFFSNSTDDEAAVFAINNAALSFTSTFGDWTTLYLQPEYSETEYGRDQDEFQLRKAFVVFGNLKRSPFYAAFGRKTIDFGNFDSYNAFTHNEGAHYFHAVSDQPVLEIGYVDNGFKLTGSALSGGRQLRVAFADEDNNIANYAVSAEKAFNVGPQGIFAVGGGYLHDTIYRDNFTSHTFQGRANGTPPANFIQYRNSAVNAYAEYNSPFLDAMVEYTTTLEPWAAAIPATPDGTPLPQYLIDPLGSTTDLDNIDFDKRLSVLVAQARIKPIVAGRPLAIAASLSFGEIGDDFQSVSPITRRELSWEDNQQHALSLEYPVSPYLELGAEYVYNKGFIPFVAPQLVSNDDTEAHAVNVGFKARF